MLRQRVRGRLHLNSAFNRYFLVGLFAFIIDTTTFIIMRNIFSLSLARSNVIGMLVGLMVSFSLNHSWVFGTSFNPGKSFLRLGLFFANNIFVLYCSTWLIIALERLTMQFGFTAAREVLCKVAVMALVVAWNFTMYSKVIFRERKNDQGLPLNETIPS